MFVLYKNDRYQTDADYHIATGTKYNVERKIKRYASTLEGKEVIHVIEITSDMNSINELKNDSDINDILNNCQESGRNCDEKDLKKKILFAFLESHSCAVTNFQVCRQCGQMAKKKENEVIGKISLKWDEISTLLPLKRKWACLECRKDFALISWDEDAQSIRNYEIMLENSKVIENKMAELIQSSRANIRMEIQISPSFLDYEVGTKIVLEFNESPPQTINKENSRLYVKLIVYAFLNYYEKESFLQRSSIGLCVKCAHLVSKVDNSDLGHIFYPISDMQDILGHERDWICPKCDIHPPLVLYSMNNYKQPPDYLVNINGDKDINNYTMKKTISKYQHVHVCMELYPVYEHAQSVADKIINISNITTVQDIIQTKMSEHELVNRILIEFIKEITNKVTDYKICKKCCHIFDQDNKKLGHFWIGKELESRHSFLCPFHEINSMLYWNMSGWKTFEKIDNKQRLLLADSDIICLTETHLTPELNFSCPNFLKERIVVDVKAEKPPRGRGKGGIMMLVKKSLMCKLNQIEFSNKGIFKECQIGNDYYILGVIYWRPEPGDETITDWIAELNNLIGVYKSKRAKFIIGGDFNARIGEKDTHGDQVLLQNEHLKVKRKSADRIGNKRGRLLLELMEKHNFILCNGRTKSDKEGNYTSCTVNGESVVDYLWVSPNCLPYVKDMEVVNIESRGSDYHRGLFLKLS